MKRIFNTGILGMILLFSLQATAQKRRFNPKQRFHAGFIVGLNMAQLDGDRFNGYDKRGVMGGLQGIALVTRRVSLIAELLYSQKGSRVEYRDALFPDKTRILGLDYAEIPILVRIKLLPDSDDRKPLELETGFSLSRLIATNIEEDLDRVNYNYTEISDQFRKTDFNYIIGAHMEILPNFNLGIRSNIAFTKVYVNERAEEESALKARLGYINGPYTLLRNYHLSLYASYQIY
ncbi:MAG: porin family protein [Bacteroidota bacterium]